ncbi:MAG: sporulation protein Cse60 [Bacilli bacterium]|nr:sporulation protein Cse60 [Bacilli bacterium]
MMKVRVFDESHEKDLEEAINNFVEDEEPKILDIKFSVAIGVFSEEQVFCFSALILYE